MKKENVIKNILVKSMVGFPVGITLLMIAYASIYFLVGDKAFHDEISQLQNIKTLIYQIIYSGLIGYLQAINFSIFIIIQNKEMENNHYSKHYKFLFTMIIEILIETIICVSLLNDKIFSDTIAILCIIILSISLGLCGLFLSIRFLKISPLIKRINKKIKEMHS